MATRIYDTMLDCGCLLSPDGGGGLIPCHYVYGCGKKGCSEKKQCSKCLEQEKKCQEAWTKWNKSPEKKEFEKRIKENNR